MGNVFPRKWFSPVAAKITILRIYGSYGIYLYKKTTFKRPSMSPNVYSYASRFNSQHTPISSQGKLGCAEKLLSLSATKSVFSCGRSPLTHFNYFFLKNYGTMFYQPKCKKEGKLNQGWFLHFSIFPRVKHSWGKELFSLEFAKKPKW